MTLPSTLERGLAMRGGLRSRIVIVGAIAAAVCLVTAGAGIADMTNTDPTGDAKGGSPDITQVVTLNDATGLVTFRITTVAPDHRLLVDRYRPRHRRESGHGRRGLRVRIGRRYRRIRDPEVERHCFAATTAPTLSMIRSANLVEFRINRSDLGNIDRFGFDAFTANFDDAGNYLGEDDAPDGGSYVYNLTFTQCANGKDDDGDGKVDAADLGCSSTTDNLESDDPVTLKAGKATVVPAKPKAGKLVVVSAPVTRVETGVDVTSGTARCSVRVGTASVPAKGKVAAGRGSCTFKTPAKAKGKTARGTITVTVLGKSKVIPFSFKVA